MEKLVRDKVPHLLQKSEKAFTIRIVKGGEYIQKLKEKLKQEVEDFITDDAIEELADIMEIVLLLSEIKGVNIKDLEGFRKLKAAERGSYKEGFVLVDEVI
jgi:predicted house-cleaning noncanonical NTP pyrophosphatase (MazG superfamily)